MRLTTILLVLAMPAVAFAQSFPADSAYVPLRCDNAVMIDAFQDESGALEERDIVGDTGNAAGLRAADGSFLYLRVRLEEDPAPGGAVAPFSWGFEFDTDGDRTDYEVLVLADGIGGAAGNVTLFQNTSTAQPNDPNDPAERVIGTYAFSSHGRSTLAPGTNYGGAADFFLSIAVPWADLMPIGLNHDSAVYVWVASSSSPNSLNGDFACHSTATDGAVTLVDDSSDQTSPDPATPPTGGDGGVGAGGRLEGGAGCAATGGSSLWLLLALVPLVRRKARMVGA